MNNNLSEQQAIMEKVHFYFKGTYQGDRPLLKKAFHPDAHITGILQGQYYDWTLDEFIERVTKSPTAAAKNELYNKEIISIDRESDAAIVKARVVAGGYTFIDYITLLRINGQWVIRNKSFTA